MGSRPKTIRVATSEKVYSDMCAQQRFRADCANVQADRNLCWASLKRDIGKQCRSRSDAAERGVWSGPSLFSLNTGISIKQGNNTKNNQTPLLLEMEPVQRVQVEVSTRHKWVKHTCKTVLFVTLRLMCSPLPLVVGVRNTRYNAIKGRKVRTAGLKSGITSRITVPMPFL